MIQLIYYHIYNANGDLINFNNDKKIFNTIDELQDFRDSLELLGEVYLGWRMVA